MRTIFVVCEGQTEETFITYIVAPEFYPLGINLVAQLISTSSLQKGGGLVYDRVQHHLRNTLRQSSQPTVTTFFDLYKLDTGFPGYNAAKTKLLPERLRALNRAFHENIVESVGCRADRFFPYIQPYEFEALLFSDVSELTSIEANWEKAAIALQAIRDAADSPEHINDGPLTKPAAHLTRHLSNPNYRKPLHGPRAAERITLSKIESECHFFAGWLDQLRQLKPITPSE